MKSQLYIFGQYGKVIRHDFHWPGQVCVEINGNKVWFKREDYIEQLKKIIRIYERESKKC